MYNQYQNKPSNPSYHPRAPPTHHHQHYRDETSPPTSFRHPPPYGSSPSPPSSTSSNENIRLPPIRDLLGLPENSPVTGFVPHPPEDCSTDASGYFRAAANQQNYPYHPQEHHYHNRYDQHEQHYYQQHQQQRQPIPPQQSPPPPVKKRHQVKIACVSCQKACKKCDDARPCGRCVRLGLQNCVDAQRGTRAANRSQ